MEKLHCLQLQKRDKEFNKTFIIKLFKNNARTEPSCDLKDIIENNEDLILLTGNFTNFFGKLFKNKLKDFEQIINTLKNNFKDRLYIEIQRHNELQEKNFENYLLNISKSLQLPLIATRNFLFRARHV